VILTLLLACAPSPAPEVPAAAPPAATPPPAATARILGTFVGPELTDGCACVWKRDGAWVAHGEVDRSNLVVRWNGSVVTLSGQPEVDGEQRLTGALPGGEPLTATLRVRATGEMQEEFVPAQGVLTVVGPQATEVAPVTGGCGC
jgi:hypothetical protein